MSFSTLGLSEEITHAIIDAGYTVPTQIQKQAIPTVLSGSDLLAAAQTGTGKTAAFVLPILHKLSDKNTKGPSDGRPPIRALILVPTRELAAQVKESIDVYGKYLKLTSMSMIGGVSINPQIKQLRSRVDILVSTPGRLLDHLEQKTVNISQVKILVLDEADRMLDMGFIRDIKKILAILPKDRQNLLFSATFSEEIKSLASRLLHKPVFVEATVINSTVEKITHKVYPVNSEKKSALLEYLIKKNEWHQVLVFTKTKHGANKLVAFLLSVGIPALAIHGNKSQSARTKALAEFKSGTLAVLVATDIAARGIDIEDLPYVINYELPNEPEVYVHRIGRTGRAGRTGYAVSLVSSEERGLQLAIERLLKTKLLEDTVAGFEVTRSHKPPVTKVTNQSKTTNRSKTTNQSKETCTAQKEVLCFLTSTMRWCGSTMSGHPLARRNGV